MAHESDDDPVSARKRLIELLDDLDSWKATDSAVAQGRIALKAICGKTPSECEIVDRIVGWLRADFPILRTPMGEPLGVIWNWLGYDQSGWQQHVHQAENRARRV
jgi:hypothetical protein